MKTRKSLIAVAAAAALVVGAAACGSGGGSTQSGSDTGGKKQQMSAMFIGSTADRALVDIYEQMTKKFNEENEFNVEFSMESYENEQYKTKLASLMTSNSQPDVFFTWSSGYLQPFVRGGKVLDLTEYLDQDTEWKDRFNDGVFGPVTFDGQIYAVPNGQAVAVMFYNTEIFESLGLSEPTTYDEFVDVVKAVSDAGITPISAPVKDAWIAGQLLQQLANDVGGIELFDGTVAGTTAWNSAEYVEAGQMLGELNALEAFPAGFQGMTNDEGRDLFTSGQAAMYYMGSWDIQVLSDETLAVAGKVGAFNIPPAASASGQNVAVGDVDLAFAVSSGAKVPEAAVEYIKMFSSPEAQEAFAYDASYLLSTNTPLDENRLLPLFVTVLDIQHELTGITPWFDRVFGAGEGVEFNNAAQGIIAGEDPQTKLDALQQFADANAER